MVFGGFQRAPRRGRQASVAVVLVAAAFGIPLAAPASAAPPDPGDYQEGDFGGFRNILPPGQNGFLSAADIALSQRPPHNDDQLDLYADLVYESPTIDEAGVDTFFKDASFGVQPIDVESEYTPSCAVISAPSANSPHCDDVTIVRDSDFGVPHIYGADRAAALFGSGYVAAEDRLFFMDVERHLARGALASFLGGSNASTDRSIFASTPYTEADLQAQYDALDEQLGADGAQGQEDVQNYVDGINQYIAEARAGPAWDQPDSKIPGEYGFATNQPEGPADWEVTDVVAIASLVAGQFGRGGGGELGSALVLQEANDRFGATDGPAVWGDFREAEDAETPTTVHDTPFPYEEPPANPQGVALPDPGTLQSEPLVRAAERRAIQPAKRPTMKGFTEQHGASNALLVSDAESTGAHPIAVMGPQVGYFAPQILMEQDIHAPGGPEGPALDSRGVGFSGVSLYVLLGRGPDYAWSATSAGQDITDRYALHLCDPNNPGAPASIDDDGYMFDGTCEPFEEVSRTVSWTPTPSDPTPAGSQTMTRLRTKLGIVTHRAMLNGEPVAYTSLRSTYFHELDGAAGFADYNSPERVSSPATFQDAAAKIGYTFNWFYADDEHIAYFNSGNNPQRPADVDPNFPVDAPETNTLQHAWQGYDPDTRTADWAPIAEHPQVIDQAYLSSWNNKQAPGYRAADDTWSYGSVHRVDSLNERIEAGIAGGEAMTRAELVDAMEDAGSVDLRGGQVLPVALKVVKSGKAPLPNRLAKAVRRLDAWHDGGAHRLDADHDGAYEDARAVRLMDAWWPRLVKAQFRPELGGDLYAQIQQMIGLDDAPGASGSAYISGWYGYVDKDLRGVLGRPVVDPFSREYCGGGNLRECRRDLTASLERAMEHDSGEELYGEPCDDNHDIASSPQWCHDAIRPTTIGAIGQPPIHWINRPTFQQVVAVQGHRP